MEKRIISIPTPKIQSHMSGFMASALHVELIELAVKKFFGHRISIYFQGKLGAAFKSKLISIAQTLEQGEWILNVSTSDIKNIVIMQHEDQIKMQCNFNCALPEGPFINLKDFKKRNPLIIYKLRKGNRCLEFFFKDINISKEIYEC